MKYLKYILFSGLLLTITSCDFLNTTPSDFLDPDSFYSTEQEVNQTLAGVYSSLSTEDLYGGVYSVFAQTDDCSYYWRNTTPIGIYNNNFSTSESSVSKIWAELYSGISNANVLLAKLPSSPISEYTRMVVEGEARGLRAYYYFLLAQCFGDVPMPTNTKADLGQIVINLKATPQVDVLKYVIHEWETIEPMVADIKEVAPGHLNKSAIRALLMRANLKMAGWPINDRSAYAEVVRWGKIISDEGFHSLNPDYKQVFINYAADIHDIKESIWEAEFKGNRADAHQQSGRIGNYNGISNTDNSDESLGYSYGFISCTLNLWDYYGDIDGDGTTNYSSGDASEFTTMPDVRRDWNIAPYSYKEGPDKVFRRNYWSSKGQPAYDGKGYPTGVLATTSIYTSRNSGKFRREYEVVTPRDKNYTPINFPIVRYSDVLLMYAEAENEVNNGPTTVAYECIKEVRTRAGVVTNENYNYDSFKQFVKEERARELCFEAIRKYDLIRWNDYKSEMKKVYNYVTTDSRWSAGDNYAKLYAQNAATSDRYMWLPIPIRELGLNKALVQNKAWQ